MSRMKKIDVALILGSDSDLPNVEATLSTLREFSIPHEVRVISAHRAPRRLHAYVKEAEERGISVFLAAAGGAAHLPGVIASLTPRAVIGIPVETPAFGGLDSLLSIVQMPGGVPVATVGVGKSGARNAALLAIQILSVRDSKLRDQILEFKNGLEKEVAEKDEALQRGTRK